MPARVNGQAFQHALVDLWSAGRAGAPFQHRLFEAIEFSDEGSKDPVYNSKGEIVQYVIKPRKTDGKIVLKQDEYYLWEDWFFQQAAILQAQLQRPVGPGQVEFTMTMTVGATPATSRTRRIRAMLQKSAFSSQDSQDPLKCDLPLFVMDITDDQGRRFVERG